MNTDGFTMTGIACIGKYRPDESFLNRKKRVSPLYDGDKKRILRLFASGVSVQDIAAEYLITKKQVRQALAECGDGGVVANVGGHGAPVGA